MSSITDHPRFKECWNRKAKAYNALARKMGKAGIDIKYLVALNEAAIEVGKLFQEYDSSEDQKIFFELGYMLGQDIEKFPQCFNEAYNVVVNDAGNPGHKGIDNQVEAGRKPA